MEILARVHAKNLVEWAKDKPEVLLLSADLTSSVEADLFKATYPERFYSLGIAEQNMLSFAAGLAREGYTPYVHTFAVFIYRRAYDQIAMSVAYSNLPVRMVGFLPGVTTPGGASHQALEDIALMRALPNMTVLECGDATDVESVLDVAQAVDGPVYIRMLRGEIPRLFPREERMHLDEARILSEGDDFTIISSGICTEQALRAIKALKAQGLSFNHLHVTTLKPFSDPQLLHYIQKARRGVITMENHTTIGGLGSAVAELMAEHGCGRRLTRIGIPDTFAHGASRPYLMRKYGIDAMGLVSTIERLMGQCFDIREEALDQVHIEATHGLAKPEGL